MNEVELLFSEILDCSRADLYLNKEMRPNKEQANILSSALKRRINGEPVQYILGEMEFMGLEFRVTPDVLIPRQETEILVETALKYASAMQNEKVKLKVLDIGTGSGCIAISLAKLLHEAKIDAIDISEGALKLAKENAKTNNVEINFVHADLFNSQHLTPNTYHLIVSNPPYVQTDEIAKLQREIQYEPAIALDGGEDGLDFYRRIIAGAPNCLDSNGFLVMEIGFGQLEKIKNILKDSRISNIIEVVKDYNDIDRVIVARKQ